MVRVEYANVKMIQDFYDVLSSVAREEIFIEMVEPPDFEVVEEFQMKLIESNYPVYYAISDERVVGWIDISRSKNPRLAHRGFLGMGIQKGFRGQGIGSELLGKALMHSKKIGLEKIELSVYTTNVNAIRLYKKFGFKEMGTVKHYRKLRGKYFDTFEMELFL